ncbi:MAG: hypothetical protein ACJ8F3_08635 [Xanthobacteraceae bacterium]
MSKSSVIKLSDDQRFRPRKRRKSPKQKSCFELYPLPFFNRKAPLSYWDVTPTGDYATDCAIGKAYAFQFLRTCDGTVGWRTLLGCIVADMIRAGTSGAFADGYSKVNGIVVGFMGTISTVLIHDYAGFSFHTSMLNLARAEE